MILVVDMGFRRDSLAKCEFVLPICSIVGRLSPCDVLHYSEVSSKTTEMYDKIILSGTQLKDNDFLRHIGKFGWLKACEKPVLGVCAGMQAIGAVFNSGLFECQEIGMVDVRTVMDNPLFASDFRAYELHNYGILPSSDFVVLAESGKCVQAFRHKDKPLYGVLFHPEVRNRMILEDFARLLY